ncbi:KAP family P-loop NTPase fold protein [Pseudoalteromonas rubra]|uniref:KAP family P-loop NTPase fold protein n=1 Tax=Pseudoalteromonas rubra TaxID=43658 RepID=UPI000F798D24|nr:P-loop NTPase fold protein [Pseudoalteromonas rubra]
MWSDKESKIDFLNFNEIAESIKDLITERELMPISVGVFGDWGAGKSTILELTANALEKEEQEYIQIHFDAWTFQGYDDAKAALLETIAAHLVKAAEGDEKLLAKALDFAKRIDKVRFMGLMAEGAATISGMPTFGAIQSLFGWASDATDDEESTFELSDLQKDTKELGKVSKKTKGIVKAKKRFSPPKEISEFRKSYTSLLRAFDKPVIVYVDNLDRCLPENTISTLEAIRLFLFMPNTAFVVAADPDMIRLAIPHFHKGASARHQTDYLDKLIQIPVHVPKPGVAEVRAYLIMLIAQDRKVPEKEFVRLRERLEESLKFSWKQAQISVDDLLEECELDAVAELREEFKIAEQMALILAESANINGNPRIVKRLLNQIKMRKRTAHRRGMQLDERTITKLVIFERCMGVQATNKLYELIDTESGQPALIAELENNDKELKENVLPDEWKHDQPFLAKWSKLQPKFTGIDLTAAAYLSRQNIPMGAVNSVISGAAQALLEGLIKQKIKGSKASDALLEKTASEEYVSVMDALVDHLRQIEDWQRETPGIYGAWKLAGHDDRCRDIFLAAAKKAPKKRWLSLIIKELEGAK